MPLRVLKSHVRLPSPSPKPRAARAKHRLAPPLLLGQLWRFRDVDVRRFAWVVPGETHRSVDLPKEKRPLPSESSDLTFGIPPPPKPRAARAKHRLAPPLALGQLWRFRDVDVRRFAWVVPGETHRSVDLPEEKEPLSLRVLRSQVRLPSPREKSTDR